MSQRHPTLDRRDDDANICVLLENLRHVLLGCRCTESGVFGVLLHDARVTQMVDIYGQIAGGKRGDEAGR